MRSNIALNAHRFFLRSALSAVHAFAWIFILQFFYTVTGNITFAFEHTLLLYALAQVVTVLATPAAAAALIRGAKRLLIYAILSLTFAFSVLAASVVNVHAGDSALGVTVFAIFFGLYRALYWVPYATERELTDNIKVSPVPAEIFIAFMPALAGLSLADKNTAPMALLSAGAALVLISLLPLYKVPEVYEKFSWSYRNTFGELFESKYHTLVMRSMYEGFEGASLMLLWPLVVFFLVAKSYILFGFILSATLLLAIPTRYLVRRYMLRNHTALAVLAVSAWLFRLIVATPFGVILVDTYSLVSDTKRPQLDMYALEQSADNATYIDELTALKEMSLAIGRILACITAALCIFLFSFPIGLSTTFVLAAICAYRNFRLSAHTSNAV